MLAEILSAVEKMIFSRVCLYVFFALRLYSFVFRSVCRVCFTCMLHKVYVLGVRMFMLSVAACFALFLRCWLKYCLRLKIT